MAKSKQIFCCSECGYETVKWLGKCPSCSEWNTFKEVSIGKKSSSKNMGIGINLAKVQPEIITKVSANESERLFSDISEWDRVSGGMVRGQAILLSGEPGIGKSTLLLQIADQLSRKGIVFYVNGEESSGQVKIRAERLGIQSENLLLYAETDIENLVLTIQEHKPTYLIIDSLQTLTNEQLDSAPGSLPQLRDCTHRVVGLCKELGIISLLVSHVTKDGSIAGPKAIEHLVDTVLFLESDTRGIYRVLRSFKNRFGTTNEAGFFEMQGQGLVPAENLSEAFLSIHENPVHGSSIFANAEGQRVFPLEVQALCHPTNQNYPKRTAEGLDNNRLSLLTAVIEKQLKIPLSKFDLYANITGGLAIKDTAVDLSLVAAICSSFHEKVLCDRSVFIGEVGLTGEIRPVRDVEKRVREIARLGMKNIYIPYSKHISKELSEYPIKPIRHINELYVLLFRD